MVDVGFPGYRVTLPWCTHIDSYSEYGSIHIPSITGADHIPLLYRVSQKNKLTQRYHNDSINLISPANLNVLV